MQMKSIKSSLRIINKELDGKVYIRKLAEVNLKIKFLQLQSVYNMYNGQIKSSVKNPSVNSLKRSPLPTMRFLLPDSGEGEFELAIKFVGS